MYTTRSNRNRGRYGTQSRFQLKSDLDTDLDTDGRKKRTDKLSKLVSVSKSKSRSSDKKQSRRVITPLRLFCCLCKTPLQQAGSDGAASAFVGSDPHTLFKGSDENLAVTDLATVMPCGLGNGIDRYIDELVVDCNIETDFRKQVRRDFLSAVELDIFLTSMPGNPRHGNPCNISLDQRFANVVEPIWLYDGGYQFHA
jgi:hypothetical protein